MRLALAICGYCLLSGAAHAEPDANKFLRDYDAATAAEKRLMSEGLSRVELGMSWVNVFLTENRNERSVYCPPNTLALSGDQLVDVLRKEVKGTPEEASRPYGLVLLLALQKAYPCQSK